MKSSARLVMLAKGLYSVKKNVGTSKYAARMSADVSALDL